MSKKKAEASVVSQPADTADTVTSNVAPVTLEAKPEVTLNSETGIITADYVPVERVMTVVEDGFIPKGGLKVNDIVRVTKEYYGDVVIDSPHATTARWDNDLLVVAVPEFGNPVLKTLWNTEIDTIPSQHLVYIRKL